ncbi:tryptophan biosynthesis modulator TrpM [Streptomyces bobili]|uniref:tryptophan biosynthesis modulator TrpM n=1 Tax=Streptomyces bobili TaxID=67280 RepID=UPI003F4DCA12
MTLPITLTVTDRYARLARGCRPRGCRAPARRVHGRRVRYVIGAEPGQVNGRRWQRAPQGRGALPDHVVPPHGRDRPHTA